MLKEVLDGQACLKPRSNLTQNPSRPGWDLQSVLDLSILAAVLVLPQRVRSLGLLWLEILRMVHGPGATSLCTIGKSNRFEL